MSFNHIPVLAVFALATLLLSGTQATIFAQAINCTVMGSVCVDPSDKNMLQMLRADCRDDAKDYGFSAGVFLPDVLILMGAGPPTDDLGVCSTIPTGVDVPAETCFFEFYSCIGINHH